VARSYLHPDKLTIVLVGDAAAFVKQLPGAGFDKFEVIPASELDLSSVDLRRKPVPARGGFQPVSYMVPDAAKTLLDKAIAAKGGLAKLQGIKTVRAEGTMTVQSIGKPVAFSIVTSIEYPDRFRVDADMPTGMVTQVYADGRYWIAEPGGVKEIPPEGRGPIQSNVQRDIVRVLLKAATGTLVVREVDTDEASLGAIEISGGGMTPLTLLINRVNGLIEKARYVAEPDGRSEEAYSDYRSVNGIQVPFHTVVRRAGLTPLERDMKTVRFNVPLPAGLFTKPS
jgi:hypothetical protein